MDATLANSMADPIISVMDVYNTKSMIETQIVTVYRVRRPAPPPPLPLWQTPLWHQVTQATAFLSGTFSLWLWLMSLWYQVVQVTAILSGTISLCTQRKRMFWSRHMRLLRLWKMKVQNVYEWRVLFLMISSMAMWIRGSGFTMWSIWGY